MILKLFMSEIWKWKINKWKEIKTSVDIVDENNHQSVAFYEIIKVFWMRYSC